MYVIFGTFFSIQDILIVVVIGVVLFGARNLPNLGRSIGKTIREFQGGMRGEEIPTDSQNTQASTTPVVSTPKSVEAEAIRPPQRITTPTFAQTTTPSTTSSPTSSAT